MWLGPETANAQSTDDLLDSLDDPAPVQTDEPKSDPKSNNGEQAKPTKPAEPEVDPTLFDGANPGEEENPDGPRIDLVGEPAPVVTAKKRRPTGYPQEVIFRPLTLLKGMGQAAIDYRFNVSPFSGNGVIDLDYGVTQMIQLGIRYGVGTLHKDGYEPGKTFSIDTEVTIEDWIAAQLSIPILADPFAVAVTLGAPMRFIFFEKLRLELGRDLITFRTNKFVPQIDNALATAALAADDDVGTALDDGAIRLIGTLIYQYTPKIAAELRTGVIMNDFSLKSDSPKPFELGVTYAYTRVIDLGGQIGVADLGDTGDTFGLSVFARFRIGDYN